MEKSLTIFDLFNKNIWNSQHPNRLDSKHHGQFQFVDISDLRIGNINNWRSVLDESLRALKPEAKCQFKFKTHTSDINKIDELMQQIYLFTKGRAEILDFSKDNSGFTAITLRLEMEKRESQFKNLTLGIVTDGHRLENLSRAVEHVASLKLNRKIPMELIMCGPKEHSISEEILAHVDRYIEEPIFPSNLPMITIKKNLIALNSTYENVLIMHDRYVLPSTLVDDLINFGGDYDAATFSVKDKYFNIFPQWTAFSNDWLNAIQLNESALSANTYLNGGIFLAKKELLLETRLNPLLFWGAGEDIEWSRRLTALGIIPKLVNSENLMSIGHRPNYSSWFIDAGEVGPAEVIPRIDSRRLFAVNFFPLNTKFSMKTIISTKVGLLNGIAFQSKIKRAGTDLTLIPDKNNKYSFSTYLEQVNASGLDVEIEIGNADQIPEIDTIEINHLVFGKNEIEVSDGSHLITGIKLNNFDAGSSSVNFHISAKSLHPLNLKSLRISKCHSANPLEPGRHLAAELVPYLISGWHSPSHEGVWSNSNTAVLKFPVRSNRSIKEIKIFGRAIKNVFGQQFCKIYVNDILEKDIQIHDSDSGIVELTLKNVYPNSEKEIIIKIEILDPVSPSQIENSLDARTLGFELHAIELSKNRMFS